MRLLEEINATRLHLIQLNLDYELTFYEAKNLHA